MHFDSTEALGLAAGLLSTFASAPQAVKIIRTQSARDVSLVTYCMALAGTLMWGAYGWLRDLPSVVLWNAVGFALFIAIIALKLRHDAR